MLEDFVRDHAMHAAIFGFFSMVWFGMAQENPPKSWRVYLVLGSIISTLISLAGIYLAITHWGSASALDNRNIYGFFGATVATEFAAIAIGSIVLAKRKKQQYISPWIALVVGVHFLPLAWVFQDISLAILATLVCLMPVLAFRLTNKLHLSIPTITGTAVGLTLLLFALRGLVLVLA